MLIEFAQTAEYWLQQSRDAKSQGRVKDALGFARKAYALDKGFECWFLYAELLHELNQYIMSAALCLKYGEELEDEDDYCAYLALMAENAAKIGNMPAYMHYQMALLHDAEAMEDSADLSEMLLNFFEQFGEKKEKNKLMFLKEAETKRQRAVYDEMFECYTAENYRRVVDLGEEIEPDFKYYAEALFMIGMSHAKLGNTDKGRECLWRMYGLTNHDARVLYYLDEIGEGLTDEEMQKGLSALSPDGNKDNMAMASICAATHRLDKTALFYAQAAYDLAPNEPEHVFRLAAAYVNAGDAEKGETYIRDVVRTYQDYLPQVLAEMPLKAPIDLSFDYMPRVWFERLSRYLDKKAEGEYFAVLMQTDGDFRKVVHFLVTNPHYDAIAQSKLVGKLTEWMTPEGIAYQRELLLAPSLTENVQYKLVYNLLDSVRKGSVRITSDWVSETFKLRTPPSYDDFDEQLKRIYAHAYCEMIRANVHSELKLSRVCERLYLGLPEKYYQANIMGYAVVVAGNVVNDKRHLSEILKTRGFDEELFMTYFDAVKEVLKKS